MLDSKRIDINAEESRAVNTVYETDDLSIFKFTKFNRNVGFRREMLEQAKEGFLAPIIVNEHMIVIDGQNRVYHAKLAESPVNYIIIPGLNQDDIVRMNTTQKPWSLLNYIESYANQGMDQYVTLLQLINERYMGITELISIARDRTFAGRWQSQDVKEGNFEFYNFSKLLNFLEFYKRFKVETGVKNQSNLALAVYELYRIKNFDKQRLIDKINQLDFSKDINEKNYKFVGLLTELIDVYNHRITDKNNKFITYYMMQGDSIKITNEYHDWTTKKTASSEPSDK